MPIVRPDSFEALGLVPIQVNTHYYEGQIHVRHDGGEYEEHYGETRDDRIREFHEENTTPVLGLWESGLIRREGAELTLLRGPVRVFRQGQPPQDLEEGADLSGFLCGDPPVCES
jgi:dipeptidase E